MTALSEALASLQWGDEQTHEGLTAMPLLSPNPIDKDYLTLDEALAAGKARVTEVSDSGSVPELLFRNAGEQAVFLLDGEEVTGAKQNRIINLSLLAPAGKDTVIPVSCVEAGRWRHESEEFAATGRSIFSAGRAAKAARVSENLCASGDRRSDQSEVWSQISEKLSRMDSYSDSSAVEAAYERHAGSLDDYVKALAPVPGQLGAVFLVQGRVMGMELFDTEEAARQLLPKVVRSYALDAMDAGYRDFERSGFGDAREFLQRVAEAGVTTHEAVGEGEDLRFDDTPGLVGGALQARGRIVHLCAFATAEAAGAGEQRGRARGRDRGTEPTAREREHLLIERSMELQAIIECQSERSIELQERLAEITEQLNRALRSTQRASNELREVQEALRRHRIEARPGRGRRQDELFDAGPVSRRGRRYRRTG